MHGAVDDCEPAIAPATASIAAASSCAAIAAAVVTIRWVTALARRTVDAPSVMRGVGVTAHCFGHMHAHHVYKHVAWRYVNVCGFVRHHRCAVCAIGSGGTLFTFDDIGIPPFGASTYVPDQNYLTFDNWLAIVRATHSQRQLCG